MKPTETAAGTDAEGGQTGDLGKTAGRATLEREERLERAPSAAGPRKRAPPHIRHKRSRLESGIRDLRLRLGSGLASERGSRFEIQGAWTNCDRCKAGLSIRL